MATCSTDGWIGHHPFHLDRVHVIAAALVHFGAPADQGEVSVLIEPTAVPDAEPAVAVQNLWGPGRGPASSRA